MKKTTLKINSWKIKHLRNKMMTALFVARREIYVDEKSETRIATNSPGYREHKWNEWRAV